MGCGENTWCNGCAFILVLFILLSDYRMLLLV